MMLLGDWTVTWFVPFFCSHNPLMNDKDQWEENKEKFLHCELEMRNTSFRKWNSGMSFYTASHSWRPPRFTFTTVIGLHNFSLYKWMWSRNTYFHRLMGAAFILCFHQGFKPDFCQLNNFPFSNKPTLFIFLLRVEWDFTSPLFLKCNGATRSWLAYYKFAGWLCLW